MVTIIIITGVIIIALTLLRGSGSMAALPPTSPLQAASCQELTLLTSSLGLN